MGFKQMVESANKAVFLNAEHFAEKRTVIYQGERYEDIPIILAEVTEKDRRVTSIQDGRRDNMQGLYLVSAVLRCALSDLGGRLPEKGQRIKINHEECGGGFFSEFTVHSSSSDMGMARVELEAIDE